MTYPEIITNPSPLLPGRPGTLSYLNPYNYLPKYGITYSLNNESGSRVSNTFTPNFSSTIISNINDIRGVITNSAGDIFFASGDTIYKIPSGQTSPVKHFQNTGSYFQQLAFNKFGHLFVADIYTDPNTGPPTSNIIRDTTTGNSIILDAYIGPAQSKYPNRLVSIAIDSNNILYFSGMSAKIQSFYADLTTTPTVNMFFDGNIAGPDQEYVYLKIKGNYIYSVTIYTNNFSLTSIYRFNLITPVPEPIVYYGSYVGTNQSYGFYALDFDPYGNMYVASYNTPNIITQYKLNGDIVRTFPSGSNVVPVIPSNEFCFGIGMSFLPNGKLILAGLSNLIKQNVAYKFVFDNVILHTGNNVLDILNYLNNNKITTFDYIISSICFKEGTKILCLVNKKEIYVPIQKIEEDMLVKTYKNGYRKAKIIAKGELFNSSKRCIDKLFKLSKIYNSSIFEDLYITGGHAILYDELSERENQKMIEVQDHLKSFCNTDYELNIHNKYKLLAYYDSSFEDVKYVGKINIYHLVLEKSDIMCKNYGIYANGLLVESTDEMSLYRNTGFTVVNYKKHTNGVVKYK